MISFGLVNVPVKAFTAVRDHDVHFHQIDKSSGDRVRTKRIAESSGREVDADDIAMGYEVAKGKYVTFDNDELDDLRPESTRSIEVSEFVNLDDIDPIYYERTYWLAPDGDAAKKAYGLLVAAMTATSRVGVGTVVMRNKQYLTAIRPLDGALAMSTMRFADEVVPRANIDALPARLTKADPKMLTMATQLIEGLTADWAPEHYHDTYAEELRKRILAKEDDPTEVVAEPKETNAKVLDLMAALEASVDAAKGRRKAPSTSAPKKRATSKRSEAAAAKPGRRTRKSA